MHSFDDCVDTRKGEDVFDRDSINFLIIGYGVVNPILLFDIEDRS
jgi:hypothetical protein